MTYIKTKLNSNAKFELVLQPCNQYHTLGSIDEINLWGVGKCHICWK